MGIIRFQTTKNKILCSQGKLMVFKIMTVTKLYDKCPTCDGGGFWILPFMKKDVELSMRAKNTPCPQCGGRGSIPASQSFTDASFVFLDL